MSVGWLAQRQQAGGRLSRLQDQLQDNEEATAPGRADAVGPLTVIT
jgi:hypothetical protein